jgi:thiol-disulfide isomerase/thioredoxin
MKKHAALYAVAACFALGLGLGLYAALSGDTDNTPAAAAGNQSSSAAFNGAAMLALLKDGKLNAPKGRSSGYDNPAKYTVINFWATWCPPCVEELPMLEKLSREPGFLAKSGMVGIAVDSPSSVNDFLQKMSLSFPLALAGLEGSQWMKALGNDSGAMPFTVILDADGRVKYKKLGKIEEAELKAALAALPGPK